MYPKKANSIAWITRQDALRNYAEFLQDISPEYYRNIDLTNNNKLNFKIKEIKQYSSTIIDYGINSKSTVSLKISFDDNLYTSSYSTTNDKKSNEVNLFQKSLIFTIGSTINLYSDDKRSMSVYFNLSPGISYIKPYDLSLISDKKSATTIGLAYGISEDQIYREIYLMDKISLDSINHNFLMGIITGIKTHRGFDFSIGTFLNFGEKKYLNPVIESYINEVGFVDFNVDDLKLIKKNLMKLFLPEKKDLSWKIAVRCGKKIFNDINISLQIGTEVLKNQFESIYWSIGFYKEI